jgi:hypothetical protein
VRILLLTGRKRLGTASAQAARLALLTSALLIACSADPTPREDGVPFRYFLVSNAIGDLQKGFGVAEAELQRDRIRTRSGRVVPLENLEEAKPVRSLAVDKLGSAWVVDSKAYVWSHPDDSEHPIFQHSLFDRVLLEGHAPAGWIATREGYMRASELRIPTHAERPLEVAPGERWIDVDTSAEILTVYDGDQPRFVTVISTGSGRPGTRVSAGGGGFRVEY